MSNVEGTLGGLQLQPFTIPFTQSTLENAVDVTTLDFTTYTDFVNRKYAWELNWGKLDEADYDALIAIYDAMFTSSTYPTFICTYYSINTPVRMQINDKDVRKDGCYILGVRVNLTQKTGF